MPLIRYSCPGNKGNTRGHEQHAGAEGGANLLSADFADIHNRGYGRHAVLSGMGDNAVVTNWVDPRTRVGSGCSSPLPPEPLILKLPSKLMKQPA